MAAVVVKYFVQRKLKKGEQALPRSVFIIPPSVVQQRGNLTRSLLLECLPVDGSFHLRAKSLLTQGGDEDRYYWLDLVDDRVQVPTVRGMVHLKCLPTAPVASNRTQLATTCTSDWRADSEQLQRAVGSPKPTAAATITNVGKSLQKTFGNIGSKMKAMIKETGESGKKINTDMIARNARKARDSVKKGFTSLFSAVKKGIGKGLRSIPLKPSAKASMVVHMLHYDLHSQVDLGDSAQLEVLRGLWRVVVSVDASAKKRSFRPKSDVWLKLGFEGPEPANHLRECGVLGLKCLAYMADNYAPHFKIMVRAQLKEKKFPVASVAVALVLDLVTTLQLTEDAEYKEPGPKVFWKMFEDNTAFFELFALALALFNHENGRGSMVGWPQAAADVGDKVRELLAQGPTGVKDMRTMASRQHILFI